jgi:hypothetical protein
MVDRTDLDALLIGALYGELTPADEARLTAHLESHPADRTALDNLTRTRAAVRDSRVLAFQREPPHAISALLLQEASRRAPRAATDRGEAASWFQRFVRSFMAHPAMAAAATVVVVITVGGLIYLSGTDPFAKSESPPVVERATDSGATTIATTPSIAPAAVAPAPEPVAHAGDAPVGSTGAMAGSSGAGPAGSDPYRARLDETAADQGMAAEHQAGAAAAGDPLGERGDPYARAPHDKKAAGKGAGRDMALRKLDAIQQPARAAKAEAVRGIELRTPQLMPKDFKDSDDEKPAPSRRESPGDGRAAVGGGAPTTPPASAAPPPAANQVAGPAAAPAFEPAPAQESLANEAKRPAAKPSRPAAANTASNAQNTQNAQNAQNDRRFDNKTANADAAKQAQADDKSARDKVLEWARKQHEQVIALVGTNHCREAASTAVEIYNRAPDYFNANIATDRQIKPCLAYVNDQRERADRSRAAKNAANAADVQAPAQLAPTRK